MDLKDKLKSQVQSTPKPAAEKKAIDITVKPGKQPFTYDTNDGMGEYLTYVDGDKRDCNCGQDGKDGICHHIEAVEAVSRKLVHSHKRSCAR
jgi:hypothetical protein